MFCSKCGFELNDDAVFCSKCGTQFQNTASYQPTEQAPTVDPGKDMGLISLILSAASFVVPTGIILPLAGAILGFLARKKSQEAGFKNDFALIGMILGIVQGVIMAITTVLSVLFVFVYIFMFMGIATLSM